MRTLVIDGGGRGQAIGMKLAAEGHQVFMSPGGPGNAEFAESTGIATTDLPEQLAFARSNRVDVSMSTEDTPLAMGIADVFAEGGRTFFGPTRAQARIEWDREWAKRLGRQHQVPMGEYNTFMSKKSAINYAASRPWPLFLKQNGLAFGKGAIRCDNLEDFIDSVSVLSEQGLVSTDHPVVVEDYVTGEEASHHAFCDGLDHISIPFLVKDHKTIGEANTGPMTGGMGVIGPLPEYSPTDAQEIGQKFVAPVVRALGFKGLLFTGLKGGQALEWNARPGDPEFQLFLSLMKSDLMQVLAACAESNLAIIKPPEWELGKFAVNLVLAAEGYPGRPRKNQVIEGLDEVAKLGDIQVIQAATRQEGSNLLTNGGRVLNLLAVADTQKEAVDRVYQAAARIAFGGRPAVYRQDIGRSLYIIRL